VDHPTQKPLEIIERMVLASCPRGGRVLDPFMGSGTTAVACARHGREFVGYEINADYHAIAEKRVTETRSVGVRVEPGDVDADSAVDQANAA
jgi:site-specific DNA-methyltransferase (adenine-specific)